jgi:transcriptional regulator with XRE-family HTH domain
MSRGLYNREFARFYLAVHSEFMDLPAVVRQLLARTGGTQADLAKRLGVTQATISRWLRNQKPEIEQYNKLMNLARQYGVVIGDGATLAGNAEPVLSSRIVGYVGAGSRAHYYDGAQGPFGEVEMPPGGTPDMVAVIVNGDSMIGFALDGSTLYYRDRRDPPTPDLIGRACVVGLPDGSVLVKYLRQGRAGGLWDLYSLNGETLPDQHVLWAAKVEFIRPPQ